MHEKTRERTHARARAHTHTHTNTNTHTNAVSARKFDRSSTRTPLPEWNPAPRQKLAGSCYARPADSRGRASAFVADEAHRGPPERGRHVHLQAEHVPQVRWRERIEDHDIVEAVQELGPEACAHCVVRDEQRREIPRYGTPAATSRVCACTRACLQPTPSLSRC